MTMDKKFFRKVWYFLSFLLKQNSIKQAFCAKHDTDVPVNYTDSWLFLLAKFTTSTTWFALVKALKEIEPNYLEACKDIFLLRFRQHETGPVYVLVFLSFFEENSSANHVILAEISTSISGG